MNKRTRHPRSAKKRDLRKKSRHTNKVTPIHPDDYPAPAPPTKAYQVLLVEMICTAEGETVGLASIEPAEFETDDLSSAETYANHFNSKELTDQMGVWAIIRSRNPEEPLSDPVEASSLCA